MFMKTYIYIIKTEYFCGLELELFIWSIVYHVDGVDGSMTIPLLMITEWEYSSKYLHSTDKSWSVGCPNGLNYLQNIGTGLYPGNYLDNTLLLFVWPLGEWLKWFFFLNKTNPLSLWDLSPPIILDRAIPWHSLQGGGRVFWVPQDAFSANPPSSLNVGGIYSGFIWGVP